MHWHFARRTTSSESSSPQDNSLAEGSSTNAEIGFMHPTAAHPPRKQTKTASHRGEQCDKPCEDPVHRRWQAQSDAAMLGQEAHIMSSKQPCTSAQVNARAGVPCAHYEDGQHIFPACNQAQLAPSLRFQPAQTRITTVASQHTVPRNLPNTRNAGTLNARFETNLAPEAAPASLPQSDKRIAYSRRGPQVTVIHKGGRVVL